ncbi:capsid cement protein [Enterococcus xiangfangensis]|uniref:DUF2190 family protein n=1 Tax=Enterococcus xiangfangensis TaxID=1296537 RepID=A0ABU3FA17_9ENTE|nr:capsid cement protein [Enterococcus xiangfangensis]MDT2759276.1 DUF2190 family protein [Enterococcus xiangfangensis]
MGVIFNRGGIIPESYGLSLTVYPKTDVVEGQPVVFDAAAGDYGVSLAVDAKVDGIVKVGGKAGDPVSIYVIGKTRNVKVATAAVVAAGDTVVSNADGVFEKETVAEGGTALGLLVLKGNADKTAEVLI